MALFYWQCHYDKRDTGAQCQDDLRWKLAETVHAYRDGLSFLFALDKFGDRINHPAIKSYCRDHKDELLSYWNGGPLRPRSIEEVKTYIYFVTVISATLPAYLTLGQELTSDAKEPRRETGKCPEPTT